MAAGGVKIVEVEGGVFGLAAGGGGECFGAGFEGEGEDGAVGDEDCV